ncbi:MAG: hypothetical protein ACI9R3_004488, partial [Verrucomicrobiales bacterium]
MLQTSIPQHVRFASVYWFDAIDSPATITVSATGVTPIDVSATEGDDDTAGVTIVQSGGTSVATEGGSGDSYTVVLGSQPSAEVVVTVIPDGQVDATPTPLTFTSANWDTEQAVMVSAVDDTVSEGSHSGVISHSATSGDGGYDAIAIADVTVTITDNDPQSLVATALKFFASPTGNVGADGTQADPYDLRAALDGTENIPDGQTLYLLPGVYDEPLAGPVSGEPLYRVYHVAEGAISILPFGAPYSAEVRGGFLISALVNDVTIRDILFVNNDPVPGGEPTLPGSFPPEPLAFQDWGTVGVGASGGTGHKVINNAAYGGSNPFSSFQAPGIEFYGNIAYDMGWEGTDRLHGHAMYIQNPSPSPVDRMVIKHNMFSTSATARGPVKGSLSIQAFETNDDLENMTIEENAFKGSIVVRSENFTLNDVTFNNNVLYEINTPTATGLGGNEFSFGKPGNLDGLFTHIGNTYIDGMVALKNSWTPSPTTNVTTSGTRVFKSLATWWRIGMRGPPGDFQLEEGTFFDITTGGGIDEQKIWLNTYDVNRANVVILDLDLSGTTNIDPSALLSPGDSYSVYHYTDVTTTILAGTYGGGELTIPIIDDVNDRVDMYVLFRNGVATPLSLSVPEGGNAGITVKLGAEPAANVVVNSAHTAGDVDVTVDSGG